MKQSDIEEIYQETLAAYERAQSNLPSPHYIRACERAEPISDAIPGFSAAQLSFGSFDKANFAVLFVDMRNSTKRAIQFGAEKTFLTMHVYLTAMITTMEKHSGKLVDITGDGLMIFWGGEAAREADGETKRMAAKHADLCGLDMIEVNNEVTNRIIKENKLGSLLTIGVGIAFGSAVVTKIGVNDWYDVKAFGNCVNLASKYATRANGKVIASKEIHDLFPSSPNGKLRFTPLRDEGYELKRD